MSWQHHLYSKLGAKKTPADENDLNAKNAVVKDKQQQLDELVERIVAMAKVLYGLHMVKTMKLKLNMWFTVFILKKIRKWKALLEIHEDC